MSKSELPTLLKERIDVLMGVSRSEKVIQRENKPRNNNFLVMPKVSPARRIIPNAMLRCSLFGVIRKGRRKYEHRVSKATINGLNINFTGQQLDQSDLDIYLELIRRCGDVSFGVEIRFFAYDLLKSLNMGTGKSQYENLKDCLLRLTACAVEISDGRFSYAGHIVNDHYRDDESRELIISLNPKIASFFSEEMWTGLSLHERNLLKGKPLAQWLHAFYSSHTNPHPYKVETIKHLCGSDVAALKTFKQKLKKSLAYLTTATGWECWIDEKDLVCVKKTSKK